MGKASSGKQSWPFFYLPKPARDRGVEATPGMNACLESGGSTCEYQGLDTFRGTVKSIPPNYRVGFDGEAFEKGSILQGLDNFPLVLKNLVHKKTPRS